MNNAERRSAVVAEALSWASTPYHHNAHVKGAGCDCLWLLLEVYQRACGFALGLDPGNYSREWYMHRSEEMYLAGVQAHCRQIDAHEVLPGDIAAYKVGRCVSHAAIIVDEQRLIHAFAKARQVEVSLRHTSFLDKHFHSYWTPFK